MPRAKLEKEATPRGCNSGIFFNFVCMLNMNFVSNPSCMMEFHVANAVFHTQILRLILLPIACETVLIRGARLLF